MGLHRDSWALDLVDRLRHCGNRLGYVTAVAEHRITRGWVDLTWEWNAGFLHRPIVLLAAEIETSKSDWVQVRNNAAKVVGLRPAVYAHIFKPPITITQAEREQLALLHPGRHIAILDTQSAIDAFVDGIEHLSRQLFSGRFIAFCMITSPLARGDLLKIVVSVPFVLDAYEVFGTFDAIAVLSTDHLDDVSLSVDKIHHAVPGLRTQTFLVSKTASSAK